MGNWIEICKAGTWTAKNGEQVTLSTGDLDGIASAYNPTEREAPLVFGHPEDNHPAFGWVDQLKRTGDILLARFKQVPETVKDLVKAGHYKKVSISLMADKKTLRHVGLLGAVPPAVPGLADVMFQGEDGVTIEFSNPDATRKEEKTHMELEKLKKELEAEKEARKTAETKAATAETELSQSRQKTLEAEIGTRIDKLVGKQILAGDKPLVKEIALALGKEGTEIELSAGKGKKSLSSHLFDFLQGLPDRGLLTEFSAPNAGRETDAPDMPALMSRV
ncbi:hypothetical protein DO021_19600 [Desulfobacter hydrogenophilus]|uniref:Peptidase n=1 Tax=Desulfobacter hydrogenophilus TaxID=2291 RepID=A0A328F6V2_9BACT|nr:hypothetical protein [Desulfobacter hydrogenophilus]NDY73977.1 hypothetical protein [Desulfobacter hydrogenophilus]QBH14322.1 hypothetical protein EYB58_16200 [Desulfobacter hydrogenophilus]RAM00324.1 hypothetical protein DO021_19600 [Desulfobacter hydrogenophilus]